MIYKVGGISRRSNIWTFYNVRKNAIFHFAATRVTQPQLTWTAAAVASPAWLPIDIHIHNIIYIYILHTPRQPVINKQRIYSKGKRCKII